jgi:hypothetical protein
MSFNKVATNELRRVRHACEDMGADDEMTALVLASHRHDRTLLDRFLADGGNLLDYVRYKLGIWEAIFADLPDEPSAFPCQSDDQRTNRMPGAEQQAAVYTVPRFTHLPG